MNNILSDSDTSVELSKLSLWHSKPYGGTVLVTLLIESDEVPGYLQNWEWEKSSIGRNRNNEQVFNCYTTSEEFDKIFRAIVANQFYPSFAQACSISNTVSHQFQNEHPDLFNLFEEIEEVKKLPKMTSAGDALVLTTSVLNFKHYPNVEDFTLGVMHEVIDGLEIDIPQGHRENFKQEASMDINLRTKLSRLIETFKG
jgi:hypothetical protein